MHTHNCTSTFASPSIIEPSQSVRKYTRNHRRHVGTNTSGEEGQTMWIHSFLQVTVQKLDQVTDFLLNNMRFSKYCLFPRVCSVLLFSGHFYRGESKGVKQKWLSYSPGKPRLDSGLLIEKSGFRKSQMHILHSKWLFLQMLL